MICVIQSRPKLKGDDIRQEQNDRRGVGLYSQTEIILRWKWNPCLMVQIMRGIQVKSYSRASCTDYSERSVLNSAQEYHEKIDLALSVII